MVRCSFIPAFRSATVICLPSTIPVAPGRTVNSLTLAGVHLDEDLIAETESTFAPLHLGRRLRDGYEATQRENCEAQG